MRFFRATIRFFLLGGAITVFSGEAVADPRSAQCGGKPLSAAAADVIDATSLRLSDGTEVKLTTVIGPVAGDGDDAVQMRVTVALKQLTAGRRLTIFAAEGKDRYGRILARAVLIDNDTWLEAMLTEKGLVRVRPDMNETCVRALYTHEQNARAARTGLWAEKKFQALSASDIPALTEALGRFVVVEGTIRRVGETKPRLYLDFGRRFTEDFTIVVPNTLRNSLAAKGSDPKNWRGKRVRVRGVLISWGGPAIEINAPAAIELVDAVPENANER
jgi:endonuclease YncB( thermonuclease family)